MNQSIIATTFTPTPTNPNSILKNIIIPKKSDTNVPIIYSENLPKYNATQLENIINNSQKLKDTLTNQALASGAYSSEWGPANFSNFANLDKNTRDTIQNDIVSLIKSSPKIQQLASKVAKTI